MKRNLLILLTVIFCVACMSLAACSPEIQTYTVTFESGGGQGTAPVVEPKKAAETTLNQCAVVCHFCAATVTERQLL